MKKHTFTIDIHAPAEKVWTALWDDANYRDWTSVFGPGSHAVSDWKEGSKILFVAGNGDGMFSKIERLIPNRLMSFKHLGVLKNNVEQPADEETQKWSGAMETYTLNGNGEKTTLTVDVDMTEDFTEFFDKTFPKALQRVKEISEK